jgi:hypothetical protein
MRITPSVITVLALGACHHNVYTPPARAFPLEPPRTLKAGKYGVQAEASGHGKNPDIGAAALRVRRGIDDNVEASAEITYANAGNETAANTSPHLVAVRAGARLQPEELQSVGITAGLGGGTFAGGPYVSADAGATLAYEGCRLTPFVGASGYVSTPLSANAVDTTEPSEPAGTHVDTPETTVGVQIRAGLALNLSSCEAKATQIVVGFGLDHFWDDDSDRGLASGGAAFLLDLD